MKPNKLLTLLLSLLMLLGLTLPAAALGERCPLSVEEGTAPAELTIDGSSAWQTEESAAFSLSAGSAAHMTERIRAGISFNGDTRFTLRNASDTEECVLRVMLCRYVPAGDDSGVARPDQAGSSSAVSVGELLVLQTPGRLLQRDGTWMDWTGGGTDAALTLKDGESADFTLPTLPKGELVRLQVLVNYAGYTAADQGWDYARAVDLIARAPGVSLPAFTDVSADSWCRPAVSWALAQEVTNGTSRTTFSPGSACYREQILTFLYRAAGAPAVSGESFSDVKAGSYYAAAARWARQAGLCAGDTFGVGQVCTRAQAVTYLWRLAGSPAAPAASFSDVPETASYAQAAAWAALEGITTGIGGGRFGPDLPCTRDQIVTLLYRAFALTESALR